MMDYGTAYSGMPKELENPINKTLESITIIKHPSACCCLCCKISSCCRPTFSMGGRKVSDLSYTLEREQNGTAKSAKIKWGTAEVFAGRSLCNSPNFNAVYTMAHNLNGHRVDIPAYVIAVKRDVKSLDRAKGPYRIPYLSSEQEGLECAQKMGHADLICLEETRKKETLFHMRIMKKVPGIPQDSFCEMRTLSKAERIDIAISNVDELKAIHDAGMIHGDVKGANYLWDNAFKRGRLIDFDFSMLSPSRVGEKVRVAGTKRYMAPEIKDIGVSQAGDIYALGKTLIEVLCPSGKSWLEINPATKLSMTITKDLLEDDLKKITFSHSEASALARLLLKMIDPHHANRPGIEEVKFLIGRRTAEINCTFPPAPPPPFLTWMSAARSRNNATSVAEAK